MKSRKSSRLWMVNVISFILFFLLSVTGLLNWLVLPRGYQARGSFPVCLRHFFIEVHEWVALSFIIMIGIHIALHWTYIKSNLK